MQDKRLRGPNTMLGFRPLWVETGPYGENPLWVFHIFGDRSMTRAHEIAALDGAQRILSGAGSTRIWMSLARSLLSMTRRDDALEDWAEDRGLVLYATSSEDEE